MNAFSLEGKIALITGGTSGIGLEIAKTFKEAGATILLHGRNQDTTCNLCDELKFIPVWGDLSDTVQSDALVHQIYQQTKHLDILVNNAGAEYHDNIEDLSLNHFQTIQKINLETPLFLSQKLLPLLKKSTSASIINVTSIHDETPVKSNGAYSISKAGLNMLTKTLSLELGPFNIRVNNLAPGAIKTSMNETLINELPFEEWIPLQRVGNVKEVALPALFLASEASSYMTGATLVVDGGYQNNLLRY